MVTWQWCSLEVESLMGVQLIVWILEGSALAVHGGHVGRGQGVPHPLQPHVEVGGGVEVVGVEHVRRARGRGGLWRRDGEVPEKKNIISFPCYGNLPLSQTRNMYVYYNV